MTTTLGVSKWIKTADTNLMISNFIDTLRLEHDQLAELRNKERRLASTCQPEGEETEAQAQMDRAVIEVEEFKASIAKTRYVGTICFLLNLRLLILGQE